LQLCSPWRRILPTFSQDSWFWSWLITALIHAVKTKTTTFSLSVACRKPLLPLRRCIFVVDAASAGRELPAKGGGVGLARKIGFDLALSILAFERSDPLLIALDADTLVMPDYLPSLVSHFQMAAAGGAVIPFCHQGGSSPRHDRAIRRYELFLRSYVLGLSRADSPYAFHTVGSAMACTAGRM
jgi:hypothetical protein